MRCGVPAAPLTLATKIPCGPSGPPTGCTHATWLPSGEMAAWWGRMAEVSDCAMALAESRPVPPWDDGDCWEKQVLAENKQESKSPVLFFQESGLRIDRGPQVAYRKMRTA